MTMVSIKENRDTGIIRPFMEANIKHEKNNNFGMHHNLQ
jgi:hypothetical protein